MSRKHRRKGKKSLEVRLLLIVGVLVLVGIVLALKAQQPVVSSESEAVPSASAAMQTIVLLQPSPTSELLPEALLKQFLATGQPTLAFFHSNNCVQCIKMIEVVEQVYPEFADSVALVDVNVYDRRNANLLQATHIRAIPTQIFFDREGKSLVVTGAMEPQQLREQLQILNGGQ